MIDVKIAKFYIIGLLARDIWESNPFQTKAEFFTTTLYSLTDTSIGENRLKRAFNYRLRNNTIVDTSRNTFEGVLKRLESAFVQIIEKNRKKKLE